VLTLYSVVGFLVLPLLLLFIINVVVLDLTFLVFWKGFFCDVNVNWSHKYCVWLYKYLLGFYYILLGCVVGKLRFSACEVKYVLGGGKQKLWLTGILYSTDRCMPNIPIIWAIVASGTFRTLSIYKIFDFIANVCYPYIMDIFWTVLSFRVWAINVIIISRFMCRRPFNLTDCEPLY
jgi:hypothetical protein